MTKRAPIRAILSLKLRYFLMLALVGLLAACSAIPPTLPAPVASAPAAAEPSQPQAAEPASSTSTPVKPSQVESPEPASSTSTPVESSQAKPSQAQPSFPTISAGEPWIVTQPEETKHLRLIRPDGTDGVDILTDMPPEQLHPDWSPDGSQLAFEHTPEGWGADVRDVWISDANGDHARPLVTKLPVGLERLWWSYPAWSPDGTAIAMIGYKGNASTGLPSRSVIVIVDIASGEISVVTDTAQKDGMLNSFPRWSPDGKAFAATIDRFNGEEFIGSAIAVIRKTDTGWSKPTAITGFDEFAGRLDWHPSKDLIVFSKNEEQHSPDPNKHANLYTIRPDGTGEMAVTTFKSDEPLVAHPTWTRDGRILFTYTEPDKRMRPAFINADGSGLQVVDGPDHLGHPRLRPVP